MDNAHVDRTICRSREDVELFEKLAAFQVQAKRGDVLKALDAANLVIAHGMFKCGTISTSPANRGSVLRQCAERFLGDLYESKISRDPRQAMMFLFNCGNYSQKHLRDAATAESKRTLSTSKSFTRVPVPFCNERGLRKKLSCALYWHQDLIKAMLQVARSRPVYAPLIRSHLRGVRYGISRQVQHYLEKLSDLCSKSSTSGSAGQQVLTIDGLYKWSQTYSKAWMIGFEVVEQEFTDILDPAMCASSAWVAHSTPAETMHMHALETVEASVARDSLAETGADAVRTGMAAKAVSGAVCGLFLTSALKAQEENHRLHSLVAAMRSDFAQQLQARTQALALDHHHPPMPPPEPRMDRTPSQRMHSDMPPQPPERTASEDTTQQGVGPGLGRPGGLEASGAASQSHQDDGTMVSMHGTRGGGSSMVSDSTASRRRPRTRAKRGSERKPSSEASASDSRAEVSNEMVGSSVDVAEVQEGGLACSPQRGGAGGDLKAYEPVDSLLDAELELPAISGRDAPSMASMDPFAASAPLCPPFASGQATGQSSGSNQQLPVSSQAPLGGPSSLAPAVQSSLPGPHGFASADTGRSAGGGSLAAGQTGSLPVMQAPTWAWQQPQHAGSQMGGSQMSGYLGDQSRVSGVVSPQQWRGPVNHLPPLPPQHAQQASGPLGLEGQPSGPGQLPVSSAGAWPGQGLALPQGLPGSAFHRPMYGHHSRWSSMHAAEYQQPAVLTTSMSDFGQYAPMQASDSMMGGSHMGGGGSQMGGSQMGGSLMAGAPTGHAGSIPAAGNPFASAMVSPSLRSASFAG